ncbi:MAG: phosphoribosylglycinamide formyltransferase [Sphingomonas fennica]
MADRAPIAVLISGRGSNMAALAAAARDAACPFRLSVVIANDPAAPGLAIAAAEGIPTAARSHAGLSRALHEAWIEAALGEAEWIALAGYMRLLSPDFVARHAGRIVNIHPSLLPRHKGLDTHTRALAAGDAEHGCTVHLVTAALDDGPVLAQARVPVLPGDDAGALAARVLAEEHRLYPAALAALVTGAAR